MDIYKIIEALKNVEEGFPFANPKQKPGDQVRGKEVAKKSKDHPFKGRLVGAAESVEVEEVATDYSKRRQREKDIDAGKPIPKQRQPKMTDYQKRRAQQKKELELGEEKTRLDPKCWKGYKKQGTKMKGDTRVNNCVPVEEEWEQFVNEYGMTTGGTVTGDAQKNPAQQANKIQQNVNKLKSAGVNIPSISQATTSIAKEPGEPATQVDKNISQGLGQEIDQIVTKGDDAAVNQLAQLIKKVKQSGV